MYGRAKPDLFPQAHTPGINTARLDLRHRDARCDPLIHNEIHHLAGQGRDGRSPGTLVGTVDKAVRGGDAHRLHDSHRRCHRMCARTTFRRRRHSRASATAVVATGGIGALAVVGQPHGSAHLRAGHTVLHAAPASRRKRQHRGVRRNHRHCGVGSRPGHRGLPIRTRRKPARGGRHQRRQLDGEAPRVEVVRGRIPPSTSPAWRPGRRGKPARPTGTWSGLLVCWTGSGEPRK